MTTNNPTANNHYISRGYLKQWESSCSSRKVFVFHAVVSHESVPLWEHTSIRGIGKQRHLYTRHIAGKENDEIEDWFATQFETPADSVIQKVINDSQLRPEDWHKLIRFLAMHDVRTPARLIESLERQAKTMPTIVKESLQELQEESGKIELDERVFTPTDENAAFPLRVDTEVKDGMVSLRAKTASGRAMWLHSIEHILNDTVKVLYRHKWTIMRPAQGMQWFTTDKPVIRLNYYGPGRYDFRGGWGSDGSEIFMPLGPEHMLYTRIGHRPPMRGTRFSSEQTHFLRRLIAEHAHRYIFSRIKDADISKFKPRIVDLELFTHEKKQWEKWHEAQSDSEKYLLDKNMPSA